MSVSSKFSVKRRSGLTLLEIMFATLILAFALIPISGLLGTGTKATSKDYRMIEAVQILEKTANNLILQPFLDVPVGNGITTYATPPLKLGTVTGKYGTNYTVSMDCENVAVSFTARPVNVSAAGFSEADPRESDFGAAYTYNFGNIVKKVTLHVSWLETSGKVRVIDVVTYLAKLT